MQDGHDEALAAADGDADIKIMMVDDVSAADFGVDAGELFEAIDGGFHEEGHETEFHVVFFLKRFAVLFAEGRDARQVDLVEGGEQGGLTLGLDQPLGDGAPEFARWGRLLRGDRILFSPRAPNATLTPAQ